jgi:hypothetical protein
LTGDGWVRELREGVNVAEGDCAIGDWATLVGVGGAPLVRVLGGKGSRNSVFRNPFVLVDTGGGHVVDCGNGGGCNGNTGACSGSSRDLTGESGGRSFSTTGLTKASGEAEFAAPFSITMSPSPSLLGGRDVVGDGSVSETEVPLLTCNAWLFLLCSSNADFSLCALVNSFLFNDMNFLRGGESALGGTNQSSGSGSVCIDASTYVGFDRGEDIVGEFAVDGVLIGIGGGGNVVRAVGEPEGFRLESVTRDFEDVAVETCFCILISKNHLDKYFKLTEVATGFETAEVPLVRFFFFFSG